MNATISLLLLLFSTLRLPISSLYFSLIDLNFKELKETVFFLFQAMARSYHVISGVKWKFACNVS